MTSTIPGTRKIKTDRERAQEELDVYDKRVARARGARHDALTALEVAEAEYDRCVAIRNHLAAHPALVPAEQEQVVVLPETVEASG